MRPGGGKPGDTRRLLVHAEGLLGRRHVISLLGGEADGTDHAADEQHGDDYQHERHVVVGWAVVTRSRIASSEAEQISGKSIPGQESIFASRPSRP